MATNDGKALEPLLREIEEILVDTISETVRSLNVSEPVYALVLAYLDFTTDEFTPFFLVAPERLRQEWLAREGHGDGSWMIWCPLHLIEHVREIPCEGPALREKCTACYEILSNQLESGDELDVGLLRFRQLMHRVAAALNRRDWHDRLNVTDDFVVTVSDWTGYRSREDTLASIPPDRRALLESRRLLFYVDPTDPWVIAYRRYDQFKNGIRQSFEIELRFWMEQLERLAARDPRYVKHGSTLAEVALDCLKELDSEVALPLLDLVERYADQCRESDATHSTPPVEDLLWSVLQTVVEIGRADPAVETLLRKILERAYRVNEGKALWATIPFCAANALHELFPRYPEPTRADNFSLKNAPQFLNAPIPSAG